MNSSIGLPASIAALHLFTQDAQVTSGAEYVQKELRERLKERHLEDLLIKACNVIV
ncbi:MAG: hypothetical protein RLZZ298_2920 [Pseudomonadota bacterium]|jgi:hypothetical protein